MSEIEQGKPEKIFISYARADEHFVQRLGRDLMSTGLSVWIDQIGIRKGMYWDQEIQAALQSCESLLLVLSPDAVNSHNVLDEAMYAKRTGKGIFPILYKECDIPFWLWRIQWTDFRGDYDSALRGLNAALVTGPTTRSLEFQSDSLVLEEALPASSKNIVICCDWLMEPRFFGRSNMFRLAHMAKFQSDRQIVYYDPGLETTGGLVREFDRAIRVTFGYGMRQHVAYAYEYLMDNFRPGDRVFIFGSGGGGVRATILVKILQSCGLLAKGGQAMAGYAIEIGQVTADEHAAIFKNAFSVQCDPFFVGLWDGLRSTGLLERRRFPTGNLNSDTRFGYHAISIDERRRSFQPMLWNSQKVEGQTVEQVWFPGVHADIAGGYEEDGLPSGALKWLVDKAQACGLLVDSDRYKSVKPGYLDSLHNSLIGPFRLLGWRTRRIPKGSLVHRSAYLRMANDETYRPRNLPPEALAQVVE